MAWDERIGRRLKLRDLHVLLAVAQAGGMARAGKQLAISQPAISKAITDMERILGVPLLERGPHGVVPTHYGRALISRSLVVFDELRQGVNEIAYLADPTTGELRIGTTEPLSAGIIAATIDILSRRHPRIIFQVVVSDTATLYRNLQERNVEFVVSRLIGPLEDSQLKTDILYHDPFVVAVGASSRWTRQRRIKLADLANEPWILPDEKFIMSMIVEAFRAHGLGPPQTTVSTMSLNLRNSLLATGRYVSALPESLLRFPGPHPYIKALPIRLTTMQRPIGIVTLPNRILSPVASLFVDCIQGLLAAGNRRTPAARRVAAD